MKKVLIFGASSFTGKHLINFIQELPDNEMFNVLTITRKSIPTKKNQNITNETLEFYDEKSIRDIIIKFSPNYIINLIGTYNEEALEKYVEVNFSITKFILDGALKIETLPKILLVGSASEYGLSGLNPISETTELLPVSDYGFSKLLQTKLAEYYFRKHELSIVIARTFNIFGLGLSSKISIGSFFDQICRSKDGDVIKVGNLSSRRDFIEIDELIKQYWTILIYGISGETYNVCTGKSVDMKTVLDKLIAQSGKNITYEIDSARLKQNDVSDIYGLNEKYRKLNENINNRF